jgi:uncharacterized SAM-binding protein YcdF (DUF218 family)
MRGIEVDGPVSDMVGGGWIRSGSTRTIAAGKLGSAKPMKWYETLSPGVVVAWVLRAIGLAVATGIVVFGVGFLVFAFVVTTQEEPADPRADAIVALTGGRDRVTEAIELLVAGKGRRLLISGVHPQTRAVDIKRLADVGGEVFDCCVDLGRMAQSTAGNAEEAARWVEEHGFTSLIVVTSAYHMPRSLIELDRALPKVRKVPFVVARPDLNLDTWYRHPAAAKLLFGEYVKYIVARFAHSVPRVAATQVVRLDGTTAR